MRTKALILAAGLGSRLRPLTDRMPKCLVPIHDRPLLDIWVEKLAATSIQEVLVNTHHLRDQVNEFLDSATAKGQVCYTEAYEPSLLGSAGTVHANRSWMDDADECLIIYADNLSDIDLVDFLAFHHSHNDPFSMALFRTPSPSACGIAELRENGQVVSFEEKPQYPASNLANAGVYVVSADAYREIADLNAFDLGHDILPQFVGRMRGWELDGYHRDIGTYESLIAAHTEWFGWQNENPDSVTVRHPAVFLDRDGTIIRHVHHLHDPDDVELLPGAAEAISSMQQQGFKCIVVTNQSVVGRGLIDADGLAAVHAELERQLGQFDVTIDGWYFCPYKPEIKDPSVIEHFDRKPGPGMLHRAARELALDLPNSWMVGDSISDVVAGRLAGCRGAILLRTPIEAADDAAGREENLVTCENLAEAAHLILRNQRQH